jgi:tetraacyldisaccharide 4'-kinase
MTGDGPPAERRSDLRGAGERWVRRRWRRGPGPLLRAASVLYGLGAGLRDALWELGVLAPERSTVPVVSVGGLTAGGSGKTPLAAELARRLAGEARIGVATHGYPDEMAVHRILNPRAVVRGHRRLGRAVAAAAAGGAGLVIVDGGFQHRRLWRDADVVAVSADVAAAGPARRLPAGPFRERWGALGRADAVVVTRREAGGGTARRLVEWLRGALPGTPVARASLRPGPLRPANPAARAADHGDPAVAVASIMYPEVFLRQLRCRGLAPDARIVLPDHGRPDRDAARRIAAAAGRRGAVGTLKDAVKLRAVLPPATPIWYMEDRVEWGGDGQALRDRLRELTADRPGADATEGR